MKSTITLVLILVLTSLFIVSSDFIPLDFKFERKYSKYAGDENWEYVKDKLFDGKTSEIFKVKGPILLILKNATKEDSLLVKESMQEINEIIPNKKIDYYYNFAEKTKRQLRAMNLKPSDSLWGYQYSELIEQDIELSFYSSEDYGSSLDSRYFPLSQGSSILRSSGIGKGNFGPANIKFRLKKDIFTRRYLKEQIRYQIMLSLCVIQDVKNSSSGIDYGSSWGSNGEIMPKDKFLLQKLYSKDFLYQFKKYLYANYPWRYAKLFLDKDFVKTKIFFFVLIIGLIFFVLIFNVFNKRVYKYACLNYVLPLSVIVLSFINLLYIYSYLIGENIWLHWSTCISLVMPLTIVMALLLWFIEKQWINKHESFSYRLIFKIVFTFIILNIPALLFISIPYGLLTTFFSVFIFTIILTFGRGVLMYLNHVSESLVKQKDVELSRLKEINAQSELKLLQSHINPHFLYNALNSIAGLVHKSPNKSEKMALSLSNLFRYSINKKGQQMSTINEEVLMVQNYLEIENIRFGDRLTFRLHIDDALKNEEIPMYILQPLVENAIKHGISKIRGEGFIMLEIKKELDNLLILVSDNGPDFPNGLVSGHGLQTVYDLLRLSYGDKASLKWENMPVKQISILIPKT